MTVCFFSPHCGPVIMHHNKSVSQNTQLFRGYLPGNARTHRPVDTRTQTQVDTQTGGHKDKKTGKHTDR